MRKEYKRLPPKLLKYVRKEVEKLKKARSSGVIVCNSLYPSISYEFLKKVSSELTEEVGRCVFVLVPNFKGLMIPKVEISSKKVLLCSKSERNLMFLGEVVDQRVNIKDCAEYDCYIYSAIVNGNFSLIYTKNKMSIDDINSEFIFEGLKIPFRYVIKSYYGMTEFVGIDTYLVMNMKKIKKDYSKIKDMIFKIKSIQDLSLVWDFDKDEPVYTDDEVYIILSNLLYVEYSVPSLNLILCGKPSSKKTPWLSACSEIFGDEIVESSQTRAKGLVPNFYGEIPSNGILLNSRYVTLLDDFFRMFSQGSERIGIYKSIHDGLENLKGLLDREQRVIVSGKGNVTANYKASFFATDNYSYPSILKEIWREDPAVLKRYTFLLLSNETEEKGSSLYIIEQRKVNELLREKFTKMFGMDGFKAYKTLFEYMRDSIQKVKFDQKIVNDIVKNEKSRAGDYFLEPKATALIKSIVILNSLIKRHTTCFEAQEEDYEDFKRLFARIVNDFKKVVE